MKIHLATDHAGFKYKEEVKEYLTRLGKEVVDHGAFTLTLDDDYPDFIKLASEAVSKESGDMAFIFGYSGEGEAMVANRQPGIRAGVYNGGSEELLTLLREHNNANVLSIGAHFISIEQTLQAVDLFLSIPFSNEARHVRRIAKF